MGPIMRELRSLPGAMLGIIFLLIVTFWVLNFLQTRAPAPISTGAGFLFSRSTGSAYTGPAAPAIVQASPYSMNPNVGF